MALNNISEAARNAAVDAVSNLLDGGNILIQTAAGAVDLVELALNATATGAASAGSATFNAITGGTATGTGAAAQALFRTSADATVFQATVSATSAGGDIELDNTSIASGQSVTMTGTNTLSMPAS